jgi:hypothetical protein
MKNVAIMVHRSMVHIDHNEFQTEHNNEVET